MTISTKAQLNVTGKNTDKCSPVMQMYAVILCSSIITRHLKKMIWSFGWSMLDEVQTLSTSKRDEVVELLLLVLLVLRIAGVNVISSHNNLGW